MRNIASIDPIKLEKLNRGEIESSHLVEGLAIDFNALLKVVFPNSSVPHIDPTLGITKKMGEVGYWVFQTFGLEIINQLQKHTSDTVRGWACYVLGSSSLKFDEVLPLILPLADDSHFGVREWAWLSLRSKIVMNFEKFLPALISIVESPSENLRRFAIEISRPRGVWCAHIQALKVAPWLALELIQKVNNDSSKYVQNSVGNWLNDASKHQSDWVASVCSEWLKLSQTKATCYICRRATRNLQR